MARRTRGRFVRPSPKTKIWIGAGVGQTTIAGSTVVLVSTLSAGALLLRPFTVLRTRMNIGYFSDQNAATETPFGDFGIMVVTENAVAIGITAIPSPGSTGGDPDADWYVHQAVMSRLQFGSSVGFVEAAEQYEVDSKAMRKVGPNEDLALVFTQESTVGAVIVTHGRMLVQLH